MGRFEKSKEILRKEARFWLIGCVAFVTVVPLVICGCNILRNIL